LKSSKTAGFRLSFKPREDYLESTIIWRKADDCKATKDVFTLLRNGKIFFVVPFNSLICVEALSERQYKKEVAAYKKSRKQICAPAPQPQKKLGILLGNLDTYASFWYNSGMLDNWNHRTEQNSAGVLTIWFARYLWRELFWFSVT